MAMAEQQVKSDIASLDRKTFDRWFSEAFDQRMAEREAAHVPSLAIIATKGTLDMAYPPLHPRLYHRSTRVGCLDLFHLLRSGAAQARSRSQRHTDRQSSDADEDAGRT